MKRAFKLALLGAALLAQMGVQAGAQAGELTLYSRENFGGREVTLRELSPDLSDMGFNDRVSSMVVRSGRWEVCVDAQFRGVCAVYEAGEYPALEGFSDRISSAREVLEAGEAGHGRRGQGQPGRRGMLELFSQRGLNGNSTRVERDTDDFSRSGFNDRANSIRVEDGNWQLCSDAQFRGTCRIFGPGTYADLGPGLTGQVSSARVLQNAPSALADPGPTAAPVLLFREEGMRGRPVGLSGDMADFNRLNFNDQAGSIVIQSGTWEFCSDSNFRGDCRTLDPGKYPTLERGMSHTISSARQVTPQGRGREGAVELFADADFRGAPVAVRRDVRRLGEIGFNDRVSSFIVHEGQWELCVDADFGGQCRVVGPGQYPRLGPLNDQISSLRRVR